MSNPAERVSTVPFFTAGHGGGTPNGSKSGQGADVNTTPNGTIVAIAVVCTFGLLLLLGIAYLLYKQRMQRQKKDSDYEKILPTHSSGKSSPTSTEGSRLVTSTVSLKTIPFTVPSGSSGSRRPLSLDSRPGSEDGSIASANGAETSSSLRGSLESLGSQSSEFRGAYSLGSIDPTLYKINDADDVYDIPEFHIGRVWFAVEYERETEKLLFTLIKAKNLPSRSLSAANSCDPFVRISLLPDERRYLQSKIKKKTSNPKFEESFVFQVSNKGIDERVIKLTVFDIDRHKRHHVIGYALYPLKEHNYESNERVVIWRDLEREVVETTLEKGEMHISLMYNDHNERLTVGIFEGKNFRRTDGSAVPDFYAKVCLMQHSKVAKTKKTEVIKRCPNPAFNESFTFKVPPGSLDMTSVSITAMQHLTGARDKVFGRIVLGSFMFARGKELEHWNKMGATPRDQIAEWHTLT